jgi:CspA family cold shock protein
MEMREAAKMEKGIVKWFHPSKGFGFITPSCLEVKDVFVHISVVRQAGIGMLTEGQEVAFDLEVRNGRMAATNLARA